MEDEETKVNDAYRDATIAEMVSLCPHLTRESAENLYSRFDEGISAHDYAIEILRYQQASAPNGISSKILPSGVADRWRRAADIARIAMDAKKANEDPLAWWYITELIFNFAK